MRVRTIAIVAVAVTALGGATVAVAADKTEIDKFRAKPTASGAKYSGSLDGKDPCLDGRVVRIIHNGIEIGQTRTKDGGKFKKNGPAPPKGDKVTVRIDGTEDCDELSKTIKFKGG